MDIVIYVIGAVLVVFTLLVVGASIPTLLLWHKTQECRYLLNMLTRREGLPPLRATLSGGIVEKESLPQKQVNRRVPPSALDSLMADAMKADTEAHAQPN